MRYLRTILLITYVGVTTFVVSEELDIDRITQLKESMIFDPSVSNEEINELVQYGVESSDSRVVDLTIQALSRYTDSVVLGSSRSLEPLPKRSFQEIHGLKNFLINEWNIQHTRSGFDTNAQMERDVISAFPDQSSIKLESDLRKDNVDKNLETVWESVRDNISSWLHIPRMLSLYWPKDDEVHNLIWRYYENDRNVSATSMLTFLNTGEFSTPKANEYRMTQLVSYAKEEGPHADVAIRMAARGLALSYPEEAIPKLIRAGYDHIDPRTDVLITLSGYSDAQLKPYYNELVSLVSVGIPDRPFGQEIQKALDRLVPFTMGDRKLGL